MKEYTPIADFKNHVGEEVTIAGWCYNKRSSKKLYFIIVRDGSAMCQCVAFLPNLSEEIAKICEEINQETSVIVTGKVKKDDRQIGGYELELSNIKIVSQSYDYPISPKEHGVAFLMENRHLWLRSKRQHAILRIRHHITMAIRNFFNERGFINVDAPIFTPNAAEGTTNLFETQYFDQKAYLSQSGQLYMEAAAMSFGKVYCFGPTFRAEKSKTRRHLTEFWMVEPEVAYMELAEDMELAEQFVESVVQHVVNNCEEELKTLERDVDKLRNIKAPFYRMSYDEACEFLAQKKKEFAASDDEEKRKLSEDILKGGVGDDLGAADETTIGITHDKPVLIHRYPSEVKAFYMKEDPEHKGRVLCFDMIAPEGYGEIIGASEREANIDVLEAKIKKAGMSLEPFKWYLDIRRFGSVPHSGFGLGIERTVAWLCGLTHVRETIPFPRMMDKIWP
ncbi:MAG: asparagine--tRNA ligase [Candidatus Riflebacteria bacterium]|nr:asparagine--tRNA ligase [Candidatus Riflebacteria bacterium]